MRFNTVVPLVLILGASSALAQGAPSYGQSNAVTVGAPDRWDYLTFDKASNRLYLSHGDRVDVLDSRKGTLLGSVTGIAGGTHGIGISNGKGYTDDGKAGEVIVFDLKSFKICHTSRPRKMPTASWSIPRPAMSSWWTAIPPWSR